MRLNTKLDWQFVNSSFRELFVRVIDENSRPRESLQLSQQRNEGLRQDIDTLRQELRAAFKTLQQKQAEQQRTIQEQAARSNEWAT
jgi:prephenate dehydrogenase